jgi:hypothetical protein
MERKPIFHCFRHVSPNFLWQSATPVTVDWFSGRTSKYSSTWYTQPPKLLWHFYDMYTIYKWVGDPWLTPFQMIYPGPRLFVPFSNISFYGGELLDTRIPPRLEDHPSSAIRNCLFNKFVATLHIWRPSPSSATSERAIPWWKEPTWSVCIYVQCLTNDVAEIVCLNCEQHINLVHT